MNKKIISLLIIAFLLNGCRVLFPTQKMIDDILPYNNVRGYSEADLIPFNAKEIKNAQALYGMQLSEYYNNNVDRVGITSEEKDAFDTELTYRNVNYQLIKKRFEKYNSNDKAALNKLQDEYDGYYKLLDAPFKNTIKKMNNGKISGTPNMSLKIILDTAEDKGLYKEAMAEVYEPTIIENSKLKRLRFGETIRLTVPATNSTVDCFETVEKRFVYVATNSLMTNDAKGNRVFYYLSNENPTNNYRKLINADGNVLEVYKGLEKVQIMSHARVGKGTTQLLYFRRVTTGSTRVIDLNIDEIVERALGGGFVIDEYKDYIYANDIYVNLKGYITSLIEYDRQHSDVEFYKNANRWPNDYVPEYLKEPETTKEETTTVETTTIDIEAEFRKQMAEQGYNPEDFNNMFGLDDIYESESIEEDATNIVEESVIQ